MRLQRARYSTGLTRGKQSIKDLEMIMRAVFTVTIEAAAEGGFWAICP